MSGEETPGTETGIDRQISMARMRTGLRSAVAPLTSFIAPDFSRIGATNFEDHDLDTMLDMIESAKPSDLENTGDALITAAKAIKEVGTTLQKHADAVEWDGEGADAFREWTRKLGNNTVALASYSETAGNQLKHASTGLATVKNSMPKRDADGGFVQAVKHIPTPAQVDTNPAYVKAKKREGDRQEAITQMNKLSSYYTVSHDAMATQKEPEFRPMPDLGIPAPPPPDWGTRDDYSTPVSTAGHTVAPAVGGSAVPSHDARVSSPVHSHGAVTPDPEVGTNIDSVAPPAPPADPATRVPTQPPSPTSPPANPGPLPTGPINTGPIPRGTGKMPGAPGPMRPGGQPPGPMGRQGTTSPVSPMRPGTNGPAGTTGRPGQMGRPGPMSQAPGTAGRPTGVSQRAIGRPGGMGTTPGPAGSRPGAMPRGGANRGIVGGTPSTPGGTPTSSPGARATTPGGEHGATTGRGVIGSGASKPSAESAAGRAESARRLATNQGGVVGTPRSEPASPGRGQRGFTQGGAGLVRDIGGEGHPADAPRGGTGNSPSGKEAQKENRRPGQPTEDEETWNTGRRRNTAPPVIE